MSAWIVGKTHIDLLVTAGLVMPLEGALSWRFWVGGEETWPTLTEDTADRVGAMLWAENIAAVGDRYHPDPLEELPGDPPPGGAEAYRFRRIEGEIDAGSVYKAIHCYHYQTAGREEWSTSEARKYCLALAEFTAYRVPGYDDAPWGFDDPEYFLQPVRPGLNRGQSFTLTRLEAVEARDGGLSGEWGEQLARLRELAAQHP